MKNRFRLIQRGLRGGTFYSVDSQTGRRESLATKDSDEAAQLVMAKNQSVRQPALSLQMAKAFLSATDDALAKRTWQEAIDHEDAEAVGHEEVDDSIVVLLAPGGAAHAELLRGGPAGRAAQRDGGEPEALD